MEEKLALWVANKVGEGATPSQVIALLHTEEIITTKRLRRAVIRAEFFRRLADPAVHCTALDIEQDLAAEYGVSVRSVQMFRSRRHAQ